MTKHTPGPWKVVKWDYEECFSIQDETKYRVAGIKPALIEDVEIAKANARLIAAAPELLEALDELAKAFYTLSGNAIQPRFESTMVSAMAAIKKAKGEL